MTKNRDKGKALALPKARAESAAGDGGSGIFIFSTKTSKEEEKALCQMELVIDLGASVEEEHFKQGPEPLMECESVPLKKEDLVHMDASVGG